MKRAADEVEEASRVMAEELPHTLDAMEDASREMEEVHTFAVCCIAQQAFNVSHSCPLAETVSR